MKAKCVIKGENGLGMNEKGEGLSMHECSPRT